MQDNKKAMLKRQLAVAGAMGLPALKEKFEELYGFSCGQTTPRNLRKRIAYRIQEIYFGGLSKNAETVLDAIADSNPLANLEVAPARRLTRTQGTRFCRVWKGVMHEVIAVGNGTFEYDGAVYKSLSAAARKITGTRWNGKIFFGVK